MIFFFNLQAKSVMSKILNPKTGKYVNKTGPTGRQVLKQNVIEQFIEILPRDLVGVVYDYDPRKKPNNKPRKRNTPKKRTNK